LRNFASAIRGVIVDHNNLEGHTRLCDQRFEACAQQVSSLRAGTITDTVGRPVTMSADTIGRIYYYSRVRRFLDSSRCAFMWQLAWALGVLQRHAPASHRIKRSDFSVQDSDRKVTLSQLHGQIVC